MLKYVTKSFALSIGISLMSIVTANAMNPTYQACYIDTRFKSITFKNMQDKIPNANTGVCYETALCLAKAEGNLQEEQVVHLISKMSRKPGSITNYSDEYKKIMNISSANDTASLGTLKTGLVSGGTSDVQSLDLSSIRESGFINFQRIGADNEIFHTVYIQVTKGGKKIIYSANSLEFTYSLYKDKNKPLTIANGITYAILEKNGVATEAVGKFNNYLSNIRTSSVNIGFHFTPVTDVSNNIFNSMHL